MAVCLTCEDRRYVIKPGTSTGQGALSVVPCPICGDQNKQYTYQYTGGIFIVIDLSNWKDRITCPWCNTVYALTDQALDLSKQTCKECKICKNGFTWVTQQLTRYQMGKIVGK